MKAYDYRRGEIDELEAKLADLQKRNEQLADEAGKAMSDHKAAVDEMAKEKEARLRAEYLCGAFKVSCLFAIM